MTKFIENQNQQEKLDEMEHLKVRKQKLLDSIRGQIIMAIRQRRTEDRIRREQLKIALHTVEQIDCTSDNPNERINAATLMARIEKFVQPPAREVYTTHKREHADPFPTVDKG